MNSNILAGLLLLGLGCALCLASCGGDDPLHVVGGGGELRVGFGNGSGRVLELEELLAQEGGGLPAGGAGPRGGDGGAAATGSGGAGGRRA